MSSYNITITPQDNPRIQTTVSVEVDHSGGAVRVTEMTVRATQGAGLSGTRLPVVDVELLLQAILPNGASADAATNGRARVSAAAAPARTRAGRAASAGAETGGRPKRATGGRRDQKRTVASGRRATEAKASSSDMRAYRRMPDDLAETYGTLKNITALAGHYGVPRHTAQGWMNRLRKQAIAT